MSTTAFLPDAFYQKSRESLLGYEDARFRSLTAGVPDFYSTESDYTLFGCVQRALAMELARFEYFYASDIVGLEPQYLTPPDIKRRWAAPLYINKSYPTAQQSDMEYQQMLVGLLAAYPQGATLAAIEAVILAYTGQNVSVLELYTLIGNGIYTDVDRNALSTTLDASGSTPGNPFATTISASALATLSENLYSAIDLAKPAHIGLLFSITFGDGEDLSGRIHGIEDVLELLYFGVEAAHLPPVFTLAPPEDPTSPITELTAYGKVAGQFLAAEIGSTQYAALLSDDYRAEYAVNPDGTYSLRPEAADDILLVDGNGNPTGVVSRAIGVLAPQLLKSWEIKSDEYMIFRMG